MNLKDECLKSFFNHLPEMLKDHENEWTVFCGYEPLGYWPSREKAYDAAKHAFGEGYFLLRQVNPGFLNVEPERFIDMKKDLLKRLGKAEEHSTE